MQLDNGIVSSRTFTVSVPVARPPMTANQQRAWNWRQVTAAKAEMQRLVYLVLRSQLPRPLAFAPPVRVTITWHAPDGRRRDPDGLAPFAKSALDAMVRGGYLPDDDGTRVLAVELRVRVDRAYPRIQIEVAEVAEQPAAG